MLLFPRCWYWKAYTWPINPKDTLLAGHQLKVDIDLFQLLNNRVQINEIVLKGITLKLKRPKPDQSFNYQFIVDAFASEDEDPVDDTTALIMAVKKMTVDNTHLVFFDALTGNDVNVQLGHAQLRMARIDPNKLEYEVPRIAIRGLRGSVVQTTPLEIVAINTNPDPEVANEKPEYIKFINQETHLQDVDFAYSSEASALETKFTFKDLQVFPKTIDLEKNLIALHKVELSDFTGRIDLNAKTETEAIKLTTQNKQEVQTRILTLEIHHGPGPPSEQQSDLQRQHPSAPAEWYGLRPPEVPKADLARQQIFVQPRYHCPQDHQRANDRRQWFYPPTIASGLSVYKP